MLLDSNRCMLERTTIIISGKQCKTAQHSPYSAYSALTCSSSLVNGINIEQLFVRLILCEWSSPHSPLWQPVHPCPQQFNLIVCLLSVRKDGLVFRSKGAREQRVYFFQSFFQRNQPPGRTHRPSGRARGHSPSLTLRRSPDTRAKDLELFPTNSLFQR